MAETKTYMLSQDNYQKLKKAFSQDRLPQAEASFNSIIGWRCTFNRYSTIFDRFRIFGSSEHDKIIAKLHPIYGVEA